MSLWEFFGIVRDSERMSNTNRRRKDDRRAELQRFSYWLESEYDVALEWEYSPRGMLGHHERALATVVARSTVLHRALDVRWEVSGEIIVDPRGLRELQAHMEILSRLMMDLQMERMFGVEECEYAILPPGPVK